MGRILVMLASLLVMPRVARAESPAIALEVDGALPCSEAELAAAVALRLSIHAGAPTVRVSPAGLDAVALRHKDQRRVLPLYGAQGAAAARKMALAIVDLVSDALEVELAPVATPTVSAPPPPRVIVPQEGPPPSARGRTYGAGAWLSAGGGSNLDRPTLTLGLEGWRGLSERFSVGGQLGLAWAPPGEASGYAVQLWALPIRLGLRAERSAFELRLLGLFEPHLVRGGDQTLPLSALGWIGGASAQLGLRLPAFAELDLLILLGLDLAFNRRAYAVSGVEAIATERGRVWLALGLTLGGEG